MPHFLLVSLLLVLSLLFMGTFAFTRVGISEVGWNLSFVSRTYDAAVDGTVFTYRMQVDSSEKDLSHWVLGVSDQLDILQSTPYNIEYVRPDPTTQVIGAKFDNEQPKGTTKLYSITVKGVIGEGKVSYSVKGGTYFAVSQITGPVKRACNCPVDMSLL